MSTVGEDEDRSLTTELLPAEPKTVVHSDFTLNHYDIAHSHANFDVAGDGSEGKAFGSFTLTGTSLGDYSTDDYFTLQDAKGNQVRFIINKSSSDVTGAQTGVVSGTNTPTVTIGLVGCSDKADVTSRFHGAINACQPTLHIMASYQGGPGTGVIVLFQLIPGVLGNWNLSHSNCNISSVDGSGTLVGMTGGTPTGQAPFSSRFQLVRSPQSSGITSGESKLEG